MRPSPQISLEPRVGLPSNHEYTHFFLQNGGAGNVAWKDCNTLVTALLVACVMGWVRGPRSGGSGRPGEVPAVLVIAALLSMHLAYGYIFRPLVPLDLKFGRTACSELATDSK